MTMRPLRAARLAAALLWSACLLAAHGEERAGGSDWTALASYEPSRIFRTAPGWEEGRNGAVGFRLPTQAHGRWIRFSGVLVDPARRARMQIAVGGSDVERPSRSANASCLPQRDSLSCSVAFWMPPGFGMGEASLRWEGAPGEVRELRVEVGEPGPDDSIVARRDALLALFRAHYFKTDEVDWPRVRANLARVPAPPVGSDASPAIARIVISLLPDSKHTDVLPRGYFERNVDTRLPACMRLDPGLWSVTLPSVPIADVAFHETYVAAFEACVRASDPADTWIVDLRGNRGGFLDPILNAVSPFFDEVKLFSLVDPGHSIDEAVIATRTGVRVGPSGNRRDVPQAGSRTATPLIAVIDRRCASACEDIAIAFRNRPRTVLVGEATAGYLSADELFRLGPEYTLALTVRHLADACGRIVTGRITPQIAIPRIDARKLDDLVGEASVAAWLRQANVPGPGVETTGCAR